MDNLTPLWLLKYLPNMLSCHVTIIHEACGPSNTITCGEASGLLSIGESMRVIERGDADLCFSGGAESKINEMGLLRMDLAGRVAHVAVSKDEEFDGSSIARPFDPESPGGALGEGGGIVLVEARDALDQRGGRAIASLLGFGAGHSPRSADHGERAEGLISAIERALAESNVNASDVDAIVPHGAGVQDVDGEEAAALRAVFGSSLGKIPLVTTSGAIGETMAGTGGIAACVGAMCLDQQRLPARLHAGSWPDDLDVGPAPVRDVELRHILVCTNSLGGQNAALVLGTA
jgi:3-oxoacyl-[acyl-carrier-protein] synthase II